ncbi:uncharacterized protein LOC115020356 [Cottoperca gobio]|uniref:Uncharacterized protein LOC115020356 n=1 Tax=Cottoperca gobio TaxID=56716 RepID=A0A6J2R818_COTGO|nr:uncharacterized protein LOC115020356 [Cottoperca gobio]XP_029306198.1 uncharacterized protein LOC115020356 [Cottoperca gobio]XP_029306206.1 uncharacterized protein LOC115020356 [Cottoperca gobio]
MVNDMELRTTDGGRDRAQFWEAFPPVQRFNWSVLQDVKPVVRLPNNNYGTLATSSDYRRIHTTLLHVMASSSFLEQKLERCLRTQKAFIVLVMVFGLLLQQKKLRIKDLRRTEVKTIGSGSDVTTICSNTTRITITLLVCRIRTERSGDECRLLYEHGGGFESECDSRFSLMMENQTVFLHLTSLTPVDSGNYTCECTHSGNHYSPSEYHCRRG